MKILVFMAALMPITCYANQISEINNTQPVDGLGKTYISGFHFNNKEVVYEKIGGLAIFEGDIVLGTVEEVEQQNQLFLRSSFSSRTPRSIIITGSRYRWIDNIVPYQFAGNVSAPTKELVLEAISHWERNTPIRFIERNAANQSKFPDYVNVVSRDRACWSYVGRRGGRQDLNVVPICGFGATVHEFGHALGLWHEHSRQDRNKYVRINWENIQQDKKHNFNQHIFDGDDIGPYDYQSIMHYGSYDFSKNGRPTITTLRGDAIGQRSGLSELDIAGIHKNYPEFLPVARIANESYSVFLGNRLRVDGSQSFDPNGKHLSYFWTTGDGMSYSRTNSINHLYKSRGRFNINLTVTDPDSHADNDISTVTVYGVQDIIVPTITNLLL